MCEHLPVCGVFRVSVAAAETDSTASIGNERPSAGTLEHERLSIAELRPRVRSAEGRSHNFMKLVTLLVMGALTSAAVARAQSAESDTTSYAWLVKAANDAVDKGEFNPSDEQRAALYKSAEEYARRAIAANPNDAEGHFQLARAIGRKALTMGARDRVKYAGVVHDEAMTALKLDPRHAGALHVMGVWNAEVMRLNGFTRMIAKNLLGGRVFGEASWDNAQKYLEEAVAIEPNRITHHLDLGMVYADRDMKDKAREQFEWIANAPVVDYNDRNYKEEAARKLKDLR
jgi:tetratricopeptide (TPR) repeat protein